MWEVIVVALVKIVFLTLVFVMPLASILTWMERRQSAMMQDRLGPNRANIGRFRAWGLLHFLADALKMLFKEDFTPAKAEKLLFALAPILALAPALIVFAIVPFGPDLCLSGFSLAHPLAEHGMCAVATGAAAPLSTPMQIAQLDVGILFFFAITSLSVYGAVLAGWSSYNKWGLLGALRASSQMMSYEVTMGLSVLGAFLVYGTLEPQAMVLAQTSNPVHWGIVTQPIGFLLFFTAAIAETKRAPFDQPEGEPEVLGYFVEYSGLRFGMFFLGEFISVVFSSAVLVTIFLGGWQFPFFHPGGIGAQPLPHLLMIVLFFVVWSIKVFVLCFVQLLVRWTLPRFRPDQIMQLGWKRLLPLSLANVAVTALVVMWLQGRTAA
jgi:NADH-quinone oxidoreductase subunit H